MVIKFECCDYMSFLLIVLITSKLNAEIPNKLQCKLLSIFQSHISPTFQPNVQVVNALFINPRFDIKSFLGSIYKDFLTIITFII